MSANLIRSFWFIAILICNTIWSLPAQRVLTGMVSDAGDGEPLVGATIRIQGLSNVVAITDVNGTFSLIVPEKSTILTASYIGYRTKQVELGNHTYIELSMEVVAVNLDEVKVIGYGTQQRSKITSAISSLTSQEFSNTPISSIESSIQGKIAGVYINQRSGKLGQVIDVRVRGPSSINARNDPLYVLDGMILTDFTRTFTVDNVPLNPLADLNLNDVESITILKDAASTSIYGARGSNGVVMITTKKGRNQKPRLSLSIKTGWSGPTHRREWLNGEQYLTLWDEAFDNVADENDLVFGMSSSQWKDTYIPGWRIGSDTDWEDLAFKANPRYNEIQLSTSGGNDKSTYYISGGLLDQSGIIIGNELKRVNGMINYTNQAMDKLIFGMKLSFVRTNNKRTFDDRSFASPGQIVSQVPVQPVFDPALPNQLFQETLYPNQLLALDNSDWESNTYSTLGNLNVDWVVKKWLTLHSDLGVDFKVIDDDLWQGSEMVRFTFEPNGIAHTSFRTIFNYTTNHYFDFKKPLNNLLINLIAGLSLQKNDLHFNRIVGRNFPTDAFRNIESAGEIIHSQEREEGWRNLSYFGRLHIDIQDKYLFSGSFRYDGDSRFGSDNRFGFFPSVSAGWVLSEEVFMEKYEFISYLKCRASWGITGNTPLEDFPFQGLYTGSRYAGIPAIIPNSLSNPALHWEKTAQLNFGLEFGILDDRFSGEIDVFQNYTNDLLLNVSLPSTSGFPSQLQNIGKMKTWGLEFTLRTYNLTGQLKWKTDIVFSKYKNQVTDLQGANIHTIFGNRAAEGYPLGIFFHPEYAGVDPNNGDALYYRNTNLGKGLLDRTTTNNINEAESVPVGDPNPNFTFGINNNLTWKGFTLDIHIQGVIGNQIYNYGAFWQLDGFRWFDNQDARILDRWQEPGHQTNIPQLRFLQANSHSSRYIENGAYLRLKNVSFRYSIPRDFIDMSGLDHLELYCTVNNLFTVTGYEGWDPEVRSDFLGLDTSTIIAMGVDLYTMPQARTVMIGVNAGF